MEHNEQEDTTDPGLGRRVAVGLAVLLAWFAGAAVLVAVVVVSLPDQASGCSGRLWCLSTRAVGAVLAVELGLPGFAVGLCTALVLFSRRVRRARSGARAGTAAALRGLGVAVLVALAVLVILTVTSS